MKVQFDPNSAVAIKMEGATAAAATDSGNPVKVGFKALATPVNYTDAQRADAFADLNGNLRVRVGGHSTAGQDAIGNSSLLSFDQPTEASASGLPRPVLFAPVGFNGVSWDRQRGDTMGLVVQQHAMASSRWSVAAPSGGYTDAADHVLMAAGGAGVRNYLTGLQVKNTHASVDTEVVVKDGSTVIWREKLKAGMLAGESHSFAAPLRGSANTALNVACITTGSEVYLNAQGFQGA